MVYLEFSRVQRTVVCLERLCRVVYEEFDDTSWEAAFTALWTCLLVGQPLRQTRREGERDERERAIFLL